MRAHEACLAKRSFHDQVVVITGGAGGIGRALARSFGSAGAKIAILDLPKSNSSKALAELTQRNITAIAAPCDITNPAEVEAAIADVRRKLGPVHVLINNAGIVHRSAFADTDISVLRKVMEVNFFGAVTCTKICLPDLLATKGLIIVVSSIAGLAPLYGRTGYAASKHALHGLFETLGAELAATGTATLMVCPSFVASGLEAATMGGDGSIINRPRSKVGNLSDPNAVAEQVLRAAQTGKRRLIMSPVGKLSAYLSRLAPSIYERMMIKYLKSELET